MSNSEMVVKEGMAEWGVRLITYVSLIITKDVRIGALNTLSTVSYCYPQIVGVGSGDCK